MNGHDRIETIVALATPPGVGGVGIVRMSGPESVSIVNKIFRSGSTEKSERKSHRLYHGYVVGGEDQVIDEVIVSFMLAPRSYTREDVVEINCHGGTVPVAEVIELCCEHGATLASPGEFTRRAFLNGRIDLSQAEAVLDLIESKTDAARRAAVEQLKGSLSEGISDLNRSLMEILASCEMAIDFTEEDIEQASPETIKRKLSAVCSSLNGLIESSRRGMVIREGVSVVICGKPNVGKSSLMNLLLKRDRVIVSNVPGTTRDVIQEEIELDGVRIKLSDTAGIIDTCDRVEQEGIKRSQKMLEEADIVIFMLDSSSEITARDLGIYRTIRGKKHVTALNKSDLKRKISTGDLDRHFAPESIVKLSVKKKMGVAALEKALSDLLSGSSRGELPDTIVTNIRHKELLSAARDSVKRAIKAAGSNSAVELIASDVREASDRLGEITGESASGDVLDTIFANFCIGK